jgi:hypothetical protein
MRCRICLFPGLVAAAFAAICVMAPAASGGESSPDDRNAFVRVSPRDSRYFELTTGRPYLPIGVNLVGAPVPDKVDAVVKTMAENDINFCRLWIGAGPLDIEHTRTGVYDDENAKNLDRILDLCWSRGIRVKLCVEYFRDIPPQKRSGRSSTFDRPWHHVSNGGMFASMEDFLTSEKGIVQFKKKLAWYRNRYGDHPGVFAWELWNEMDCVRGPWLPWTDTMLAELHRLFPKNLAVQSLGSFDHENKRLRYGQLARLAGNDVAQVHRYLDLGAKLTVCHGPMDVLAADAVRELLTFSPGRPVILAESGAVEPGHSGPFKLFKNDKDGLLLHDILWAPFFAGAAGTGQCWFWQNYIDANQLWWHFARFSKATQGLDPPAENFIPCTLEHNRLRIYVLHGRHTVLLWCRDAGNDWRAELEQGEEPRVFSGERLDLNPVLTNGTTPRVRAYDPWRDTWADIRLDEHPDRRVKLPDFQRSILVRLDLR